MNEKIRNFGVIVIALALEAALFVIIVMKLGIGILVPSPRGSLDIPKIITLIACIVVLVFTLSQFLKKILKKPSIVKILILLALLFLILSFTLNLFMSIYSYSEGYMHAYVNTFINTLLVLGFYCLNLFAFSVIYSGGNEKLPKILKITLDMMLLLAVCAYVIGEAIRVTILSDESNIFSETASILLILAIFFTIVNFIFASVKLSKIVKKTEDEQTKQGLRRISTSFTVLVIGLFLLILANTVEELDDFGTAIVLSVAAIAFYFIYSGFVKPSGN
ncbi:MAG: hypothetical protein ACFFCS_25045 [Candidatus Hodarchaeota archaeon]